MLDEASCPKLEWFQRDRLLVTLHHVCHVGQTESLKLRSLQTAAPEWEGHDRRPDQRRRPVPGGQPLAPPGEESGPQPGRRLRGRPVSEQRREQVVVLAGPVVRQVDDRAGLPVGPVEVDPADDRATPR